MSVYKTLPNSLPLPIYFYEHKNYNEIRRAKIILFSHICNSYETFKKMPMGKKFDIIKKIERSCYNTTVNKANNADIRNTWSNPKFSDIYITVCMKISVNLEDSEKLFNKVINEEIKISELGSMSSQKLQPELHEKIINKIEQRFKQVIHFKECKLYKCNKCKSSKCTAEKLYNRGLDEGVNFKITCQECGNEWSC